MDEQQLNRVRFFRECAADCRARAKAARVGSTRTAYLELAMLWEQMAAHLEKALATGATSCANDPEEPKAAS